MNRLLIGLTVALGILMWTSSRIDRRRQARRVEESAFVSLGALKNVKIDSVAGLEVRIGTRTESWRYSLCDGAWRYPGYFNAYVETPKIQALMNGVLNGLGTKIVRRQKDTHYGLTLEKAVKLTFLDDKDKPLMEAWLGKVIAGRSANASYMKTAKERDICLIHTNPHHLLAVHGPGGPRSAGLPSAQAPMIDTRVFPGFFGRKSVSKVLFRGRKGYQLKDLFRVEIEKDESSSPGKMPADHTPAGREPEGPRIEWHGNFAGKKEVFLTSNASAYVGFLSQLRYETIVDGTSRAAKNFRRIGADIKAEGDYGAPEGYSEDRPEKAVADKFELGEAVVDDVNLHQHGGAAEEEDVGDSRPLKPAIRADAHQQSNDGEQRPDKRREKQNLKGDADAGQHFRHAFDDQGEIDVHRPPSRCRLARNSICWTPYMMTVVKHR